MVGRDSDIAVYIVASGRNATLYTGVTSQLQARTYQHKTGAFPGFSQKHRCTRLVWYERFELMTEAIAREKKIKHWLRPYKLALIEADNPDWRDLSEGWWD
jgi:putative endonuclease